MVKGKPVLSWAILPALAAGLDGVVVVGGAADLRAVVPESVTLIQNDDWSLGLAKSLKVGLEWCGAQGHDRAVIGLGDMPVRLDAEIWSMLPSSGDEGARSLARAHPELVREVACVGATDDIDTPEDLQRWS